MTVPLDKHRRIVSPALAPTQSREADTFEHNRTSDAVLRIGLVNNMPDPALQATERQFTRLLQAAAGERRIHLHCFSLPSVQRLSLIHISEPTRQAETSYAVFCLK